MSASGLGITDPPSLFLHWTRDHFSKENAAGKIPVTGSDVSIHDSRETSGMTAGSEEVIVVTQSGVLIGKTVLSCRD